MEFTLFDIACAIIFVLAAIRGFSKGLLHEALSLLGFFVALWLALSFSEGVGQLLIDHWELGTKYSNFIAFVVLFFATIFLIRLLSFGLTKLAGVLALGFINRLLGGLFSFLKMAFVVSLLLQALHYFDSKETIITSAYKDKSLSYRPIENLAPELLPFIGLDEYFNQ